MLACAFACGAGWKQLETYGRLAIGHRTEGPTNHRTEGPTIRPLHSRLKSLDGVFNPSRQCRIVVAFERQRSTEAHASLSRSRHAR